ncbi:TrbI/VirB10 family protein [Altererythrobacter lutimaris]|uniref:TrbI/VirB10 family protein n=1 Tax=Altererythrobacter lutimaris TaxID=2743979 RepID=A0A850HB08_9SPHN|nr:TrbI/VirB10 family protein [Altererythrobacter lutimaris]NVE94929.1 TrbI/VirB10 family protein [Altererythrobacter lutimaris]
MRLPSKGSGGATANDADPRETASAEVIDLASRTAYPAVTQNRGKKDGFGLAAGISIVALLGALTLSSMNSARLDEPEGNGNPDLAQAGAAAVPARVPQPQIEPQVSPQTENSPVPMPAPAPAGVVNSAPAANPYASPTMVFDASAAPVPLSQPAGEAVTAPGGSVVEGAGSAAAQFASRIGGVGGAPAQASAMANPSTTVTQGTLIPAILETAIDTDVPGYVRAVVSQDVRSFDGTSVLVPRSSRLIGQYQSGLQGGQKRAYVIWTRLIRPDGASVNLASPAVGFDGTTGLEGKVKSNFFKRFGSSLLLSVVGGLGAVASGGASVVIGGAGQSAAAAAVQQDGQIGPTVRVPMGEPIRVFTARDLDFSAVSGG